MPFPLLVLILYRFCKLMKREKDKSKVVITNKKKIKKKINKQEKQLLTNLENPDDIYSDNNEDICTVCKSNY